MKENEVEDNQDENEVFLNDIHTNLDSDLDISKNYKKIELKVSKIKKNTTNDIFTFLNKKIKVDIRKYVLIKKNKTKNFDSLTKNKKYIDIELLEQKENISNKKNINFNFFNLQFIKNLKKIKFNQYIKSKKNNYFLILKNLKNINLKNYFALQNNKFKSSFLNKYKSLKLNFKISKFKKTDLNKNNKKRVLIITLISLIFIVWLAFLDKIIIENRINSWYKKLISIKDNFWDTDYISKTINDAKFDFILADILFKPFLIINNNDINNWYHIINWGKKITNLIDESFRNYILINNLIEEKNWIENIKVTNLLYNMQDEFSYLLWLLENTIISYDMIWDLWSNNLNNNLSFVKDKLTFAYKSLDIINKDFDVLLSILWHNSEKKYLILFQNNDEIRPTGGFIWSLALATIKNWKLESFEKDDVYAYEWEINKVYTDKQKAPKWLDRITWTFWLRDANYFVDFKDSSNSINYFLEKIDKKVDWIIYINQNIIRDFLDLTWWIYFDTVNEVITSENFSILISTLVEAETFKLWTLGTPKQILFDFANLFFAKLKQDKDYFWYLDIIIKNIKSRDLVIYSLNSDENNLLWKLWLNWTINYSDTFDFAYPVFTSIWWNKSDRYIELRYKKQITKNNDCSIDTNLNITRTHYFSSGIEQKVNTILDNHPIKWKTRTDVLNIQWKWDNFSYVRVVLPKNAKVENKTWLNITKLEKITVVDFFMKSRLLESTSFDIKYTLENNSCLDYDYKFYKQAWIRDYDIEIIDNTNHIKEYNIENDFLYKNW